MVRLKKKSVRKVKNKKEFFERRKSRDENAVLQNLKKSIQRRRREEGKTRKKEWKK